MTRPRDLSSWLPGLVGPVEINTTERRYMVRRPVWRMLGVTITDVPDHTDDEGNVVGRTDFAFDTASVEVQDDIAKSGIVDESTIDRVKGFIGVPLKNDIDGADLEEGTAPPRGGAWVHIDGAFAPDHPVPKGWFDPRHYGARFDGTTDDIEALERMQDAIPAEGGWVHWPNSMCWVSRTFVVRKPLKIRGQGGNDARLSGLMVAPGPWPAIEFMSVGLYDGPIPTGYENGAAYFELHNLNVESHILIAPDTARGSIAGDRALVTMNTDHALVRNGDCYVKPGNAAPTRMFRARTPTNAAVLTSGTPPAWTNTIGATLTDSYGIQWTTESVPDVRQDLQPYVQGDRVLAKNDNRYIYECLIAGTSNASPPAEFSGGPFGRNAITSIIGGQITDGTVVWEVKVACGVYANATQGTIDRLFGYRLTGYLLHVQAGSGMDARGNSDANNIRIRHIYGAYVGGVCALMGDNVNGWSIDGIDGIKCGAYHPAATLFLDNGGIMPTSYGGNYPDGSRGGHILYDGSQGGGSVDSLYGQIGTGKPICKRGNGARTSFVSCFHEYGGDDARPFFTGGVSTIIGGNIVDIDPASTNVTMLDPQYGRGVSESDYTTGHATHLQLSEGANNRFLLLNRWNDSSQGGWSYAYDPTSGRFARAYNFNGPTAGSIEHVAYELALAAAGLDPGPGWLEFRDGFLLGRSGTDAGSIFVGHLRALTSVLLRGGLRRAGDQFVSGVTARTLTSDGFRGVPWQASHDYFADNATNGQRGDMVEPTSYVETPNGTGQVWECTTAGTSAGSEPSWPGSPTVNVTTVTDGTVTWTYRGTTPTYQTSVLREDRELTTTATTANQVIGSVTLPSAASGKVDVYRIFVSFIGGGNGGRATGKVEGSFEVSDTGTVTRHGTDDTSTVKGTGALASSTFNMNPTTNAVQFRVTPGTATSSNWKAIVQFEPLTGATA